MLSGVKPGDEVVTSGVFKLRNGAAVADQQHGAAGEQPGAQAGEQLMKFTDLFIKRPVLAIVVNLVILIAGLQSIRALSVRQYPRSDIAVIRVSTVYVGANADLVRGFITTPLERVIASADGIDYMESSSAQALSTITVHLKLNYDTNAALTQIQAKVAQVRNDLPPEAEAPIIELETADTQFAAMYIGFSSADLDQTPDHRLPHTRRPAEAERDQRRAARRHPRRPDVRDARLAEARPDGGARDLAVGAARRAGAQQLPVGARPHQGLDGLGEPGCQHRSAHAPKSSASWSSRSRTASSSGWATSPTSCWAPRTTTRTSASTARRRRSWASGCCRPPIRSKSSAASARRCRGIEAQLPAGMKVGIPYDSTEYINDAISEVLTTLTETLLIVIVVIFLFLGSLRSVIIPIVAIPISLVGAVFLMLARRLHDQPADPARHRAVGRSRRRRRDRDGGERRAASPRRQAPACVRRSMPRASSSGRSSR